ncbi:AIG2-like family protein [Alteromonas macleodii]|nr:AIG2-like family protein [Alteromonas macleodii]
MDSLSGVSRMTKKLLLMLVITTITFALYGAGIHAYVQRDVAPPGNGSNEQLWYFAYGSNMSTRYLTNVRDVAVYESVAGTLRNHTVSFTLPGIPSIEPRFAELSYTVGEKAYGVLHRIDVAGFVKVLRSEGDAYQIADIVVTGVDGKQYKAKTLIVDQRSAESGSPSERYRNIILEGAREHGLPDAYIAQLENTETAYIPLLSEAAGTAIYTLVIVNSL